MEFAGLALAIPPILVGFMKIVKSVNDIRTKYNTIPSSMQAVAAYCGLVHVAILHLKSQQFQEALASVPEATSQALEHVETLLLGCKGVLCQLEAYTVQYAMAAEHAFKAQKPSVDILQLTRLVWKEPEITDLLTQLRDYKDGIDTVRQICMSHSLEIVQTKLSHYTSALDYLLERSHRSWNHDLPLILASRPESLRFSFISHMSLFSTTALYINQDHERQSATAFDFDYEVVNTKSYRRAMVEAERPASIAADHPPLSRNLEGPVSTDKHTEGGTLDLGKDLDTTAKKMIWPPKTARAPLPPARAIVPGKFLYLDDRQPAGAKNFSLPNKSLRSPAPSQPLFATSARTSPAIVSSPPADTSLPKLYLLSTKFPAPQLDSPLPKLSPKSVISKPTTSLPPSSVVTNGYLPNISKWLPRYSLAVLGGLEADKSPLALTFLQSLYTDSSDPTREDSFERQCKVDDEIATVDVLDTAGQEGYSAMREQYMRECEGFALIYSITSRQSFEEISTFYHQVLRVKGKDFSYPMVLVGNHCDRDDERVVSREEGAALAKAFDCPFMEASSTTKINVDMLFYDLVREVRMYRRGVTDDEKRAIRENSERERKWHEAPNTPQRMSVGPPPAKAKRSSSNHLLSPLLERFRG